MNKIQVKILDHNLNGMPIFLARLTQRGHLINNMDDLMSLYDECINKKPSTYMMTMPHDTIRRMSYMTIAIVGLSTKAVSQLRTHATRLTFMSTSTQYSSYEGRSDNFVLPQGLDNETVRQMTEAYAKIEGQYAKLIKLGIDKDKVGYLLPQGLRKALVISGNLKDWQYVIKLRLCHRNTEEVQYIMRLLLDEIEKEVGPEFIQGMLPSCADNPQGCKEGRFCCGKRFVR